MVNDVVAMPPNPIDIAPVKSVPVIVTVSPCAAVVGVKEVIVGACVAGVTDSSFLQEDKIIPNAQKKVNIFIGLIFNLDI
jgi:hypothetical protein